MGEVVLTGKEAEEALSKSLKQAPWYCHCCADYSPQPDCGPDGKACTARICNRCDKCGNHCKCGAA